MLNQWIEMAATFEVTKWWIRFYKFEDIVNGDTTIITLKAKYEGCLCTDIAFIVLAIYKFKKSKIGTYQVKFWKGNSYIDHTIVVQ